MEEKKNLFMKQILEEKYKNCGENAYKRAYQSFLFKLMNDKNNSINMNIYPIKLERSINIIK